MLRRLHPLRPILCHGIFRRNEHATRSNDFGANLSIEFGMTPEQRPVEAKAERITGLRLFPAIFVPSNSRFELRGADFFTRVFRMSSP